MPSIRAIGNGWPRAAAARRASRAAGPPSTATGRAPQFVRTSFQDQAVGGVVVHDQDRQPLQAGSVRHRRRQRAVLGLDAQRDREPEGAAHARLALDPDPSSHQLDQLGRDRQAQPRAAEPAGRRAVGLLERLEDRLQLLGGDADPGVGDRRTGGRTASLAEFLERDATRRPRRAR